MTNNTWQALKHSAWTALKLQTTWATKTDHFSQFEQPITALLIRSGIKFKKGLLFSSRQINQITEKKEILKQIFLQILYLVMLIKPQSVKLRMCISIGLLLL